ncbi:MAG: hypothetical protein FWE08_06710 [Oscillospiraceae bacterium]|nr:hypothetical protein [Oscillospiraceae bacterium]
MKHDILHLSPVTSYTPPHYPTCAETNNNPALLKRLPSGWRRNTAVLACIGLLGVSALSGCFGAQEVYNGEYTPYNGNGTEYAASPIPEPTSEPTPESTPYIGLTDFDISVRIHHGGDGASPLYVAYLTEQEALNIVRMRLESAGLNFGATPPEYVANIFDGWREIPLDLYDEERGVAVAFLDDDRGWDNNEWFAEQVTKIFAEQTDIPIGVFYNPFEILGESSRPNFWFSEDGEEWENAISDEDAAEAGPILARRLDQQILEFLMFLQGQRILP